MKINKEHMMGIVREEIQHDEFSVDITVVEKEQGEFVDPWRFCTLNVDSFERFTPSELRQFGQWLSEVGTRLTKEYDVNGKPSQ